MKKDLAALQGTWQITSLEVDGEVVEPAPAEVLPMAQRYFLF